MRKLFPGAILGLALVVATSGMSRDVINGYQPRHHTKTTTEPAGLFYECYFFPWLSWCHLPKDPPKIIQPSVPPGCCTPECMGPCL